MCASHVSSQRYALRILNNELYLWCSLCISNGVNSLIKVQKIPCLELNEFKMVKVRIMAL